MISLRHPSGRARSTAAVDPQSALVATVLAFAAFGATFASVHGMRLRDLDLRTPVERAPETIAYIAPRPLAASVVLPVQPPLPTPSVAGPKSPRPAMVDVLPSPSGVDTSSAGPLAPALNATVVTAPSARLAPSPRRAGTASWIPGIVYDPFVERAAPPAAVRDSLLGDLRAAMPAMARTRVYTPSERDAVIKEGMLRNKVSGRVLLDPPVGNGTYSGTSGGIDLPLFSPGPSRAVRVRDSIAYAEGRTRLARLAARADSLRRTRESRPARPDSTPAQRLVPSHPSAFFAPWPLEHDRQPMLVLRHHRRPPTAPATLVEQVGQRILVVACVPRQP